MERVVKGGVCIQKTQRGGETPPALQRMNKEPWFFRQSVPISHYYHPCKARAFKASYLFSIVHKLILHSWWNHTFQNNTITITFMSFSSIANDKKMIFNHCLNKKLTKVQRAVVVQLHWEMWRKRAQLMKLKQQIRELRSCLLNVSQMLCSKKSKIKSISTLRKVPGFLWRICTFLSQKWKCSASHSLYTFPH